MEKGCTHTLLFLFCPSHVSENKDTDVIGGRRELRKKERYVATSEDPFEPSVSFQVAYALLVGLNLKTQIIRTQLPLVIELTDQTAWCR